MGGLHWLRGSHLPSCFSTFSGAVWRSLASFGGGWKLALLIAVMSYRLELEVESEHRAGQWQVTDRVLTSTLY